MTFTLALTLISAIIAIALGFICYSLLARVDTLERAVVGGLKVPSRRLTREQFEYRLRSAHNRVQFATHIEYGLVIFVGSEIVDGPHELKQVLVESGEQGFHIIPTAETVELRDTITAALIEAGISANTIDTDIYNPVLLGVTSTPYAMLVDQGRILEARPVITAQDLISLIRDS